MFTGIIQAIGSIGKLELKGGDCRLSVTTGKLPLTGVALGDSIAVSGVCLTAVELGAQHFCADVSKETLSRTTLGNLVPGSIVNLELALTPSTRMGGHIVSGHVDGVGCIIDRKADARSVRFVIEAPESLAKYIAEKGSICVDGISLTVNAVDGNRFDLNIIPHTLKETTMGDFQPGRAVNLEVDLLARYLERLMLGDKAGVRQASISVETLISAGFLG